MCSTVRKKGELTSVEHAADIEHSTYNVELRSNLKNAHTCHSMMNDKFKQESGHKKKERERENLHIIRTLCDNPRKIHKTHWNSTYWTSLCLNPQGASISLQNKLPLHFRDIARVQHSLIFMTRCINTCSLLHWCMGVPSPLPFLSILAFKISTPEATEGNKVNQTSLRQL